MNKLIVVILLSTTFLGCNQTEEMLFKNLPPEHTGISFNNVITETNDLSILDYLYFYNGGGVAIGDINNDGLPDIFLSGNQVKNKLYLNKGQLKFEDITAKAGVSGNSSWNTGVAMGDVNGDGLLDIYVCAVVGLNGFYGYNELYINNGDNTFTEKAKEYKLDFDTYSSSAAFLDFDLDGDLDIYLLNHAVHTQESYGHANLREKRNYQTGDKLLRNDGGVFIDVSEASGIFGGPNGYGLGIAIADFNQDGFPDIYVGNDFHEDDYYYINNGDSTFSEKLKDYFGHTTRFSMGNDVADINHDGKPDIMSLDMLPESEKVLKSSEGDDNVQIQKLRTQRFGYHYQYTRNMLHINQGNSSYLETALLSGVAATDWSWSCLFADYNQDGEQDIFISNGIPKRPNNLDFIKFVSSDQIRNKINNTKLVDQEALNMMPSGKTHNFIYKGSDNLKFEDKSGTWIEKDNLVSGATAFGDLDNDGDLDLIVNNINNEASVYVNQIDNKSNYLKLKFNYSRPNSFGIGTKVFSYSKNNLQYKELYCVRGFQASSEPFVHFGYGEIKKVDSIKIVWPDRSFQIIKDIAVNQTLTIRPDKTKPFDYDTLKKSPQNIFKKVESNLGIDFTHQEDGYTDFNRQKLIPYQVSDRGPGVAIGDINNDGKQDVYFGGSKYKPSKIFIQTDSIYQENSIDTFVTDSIKEDVSVVISDFNNDGKNDLFVGTGGADFYNKMKPLLNSYYVQNNTGYESKVLPEFFENTSVVESNDFDKDGDLDLFVGNNVVSNDFGKIPSSYILKNHHGTFSALQNETVQYSGMITDAIWDDFNQDGFDDLILVGEWMSPKFFKNINGKFTEVQNVTQELNGLWQQIYPFDIDNDGDKDYLIGNWGINSKFKASKKHPMRMYYADFDNNGSTETVVCTYKNGKYYPLLGLDKLAGQMEGLRKKFTTYKSFAGKSIEEIFEKSILKKAKVFEVNELRSGYLKNNDNQFTFIPFDNKLQIAPITAFLDFDFDGDEKLEVLVGGNYFGVEPFHGRFDSFPGALIKNEDKIILGNLVGLDFSGKAIRHLDIISLKGKSYLLVTINNDKAQVYELTN